MVGKDAVGGDVTKREAGEVPVVGLDGELQTEVERRGDEVAVGEDGALGEPGRAARVQQPGWILLGRARRRGIPRGRREEVLVGDAPCRRRLPDGDDDPVSLRTTASTLSR
jgi:hypothetical protein